MCAEFALAILAEGYEDELAAVGKTPDVQGYDHSRLKVHLCRPTGQVLYCDEDGLV